jgi:hypothetical protein
MSKIWRHGLAAGSVSPRGDHAVLDDRHPDGQTGAVESFSSRGDWTATPRRTPDGASVTRSGGAHGCRG